MPTSEAVLVLLAHGSPDAAWRRPFETLRGQLQSAHGEYRIRLAYLEFIRPTLGETIDDLITAGATDIRVLPLFMATGGHFKNDIEPMVDDLNGRRGDVVVTLLAPIGEHPALIAAIRSIADNALID